MPVVHVIGAGLAGLAAALRLAPSGASVVLHEAAGQAGGRCRSYFDATLGITIDNGNHVVLSGNHAARAFLAQVGATDRMRGPAEAAFPFVDIASGERWCVRPNAGRLPWWIFDAGRRVPATRAMDYLALAPLAWAPASKSIAEVMNCSGPLYERLWRPLLLAALNTDPAEASAALAGAVVRETLALGGHACRPLIAPEGLTHAFIDPALTWLAARGVTVRFSHRLRAIGFGAGAVSHLDFGDEAVALAAGDAVVLAVPAPVAAALVPGLPAPAQFRAIVNAHFRIDPPPGLAPMIGLINSTAEWVFAFHDRLSVTISGADRLLDTGREALAQAIWSDVRHATGVTADLPPWQIIKEKRATFAALPAEEPSRPGAATAFRNLALAGDWTATGLPATIEGAIRSGNRAADLIGAVLKAPAAA